MKIITLKLLTDNYSYIIYNQKSLEAIVIDPSEAKPIINYLKKHNLHLMFILNTHHHNDHTCGNKELKNYSNAKIICSAYDKNRIELSDIGVNNQDVIDLGFTKTEILYVPGHTLGHINFYFPDLKAIFTGDCLFSLGCGRLFEGTAFQLFASLNSIRKLPIDTEVFCGHEYTKKNAEFALSLEPSNNYLQELYANLQPCTIPSTIEKELKANPFLRTNSTEIRNSLNLTYASDLEVFTKLRELKNEF